MITLVETMLKLHEVRSLSDSVQKATSKTPDTAIERQITETDKAIDTLVYQLYDLTPEDIAIVEGNK